MKKSINKNYFYVYSLNKDWHKRDCTLLLLMRKMSCRPSLKYDWSFSVSSQRITKDGSWKADNCWFYKLCFAFRMLKKHLCDDDASFSRMHTDQTNVYGWIQQSITKRRSSVMLYCGHLAIED